MIGVMPLYGAGFVLGELGSCCVAGVGAAWNTPLGRAILTLGGSCLPSFRDNKDSFLRSGAAYASTMPLLGGPCAVLLLVVHAAIMIIRGVVWAVEKTWSSPGGKVVLTLGGWLVPRREDQNEDCAYQTIRSCGQLPLFGGPLAAVTLPVYAAARLIILLVRGIVWAVEKTWSSPGGKVVLTLGGWLVPRREDQNEDRAYQTI